MATANPYKVISAIFHFYPEDEFGNDREKIHSAFFDIRSKHFDLLKDLIFRRNLLFHRSRLLDEILASLQPEFLGKINPGLDVYKIKRDRLEKLWEKDLKSTLVEKEAEIKEVASELCRLLEAH
jgi:hypothetical protein